MDNKDSVYLLLGPEQGEKDLFIGRLVERISRNMGVRPEIQKFYPFDTNLVEVVAILRNGTLFTDYRVVLLNNVEEISKKRDLDLLSEYCAHPASGVSFLLLSDEIKRIDIRKRIEKLIPKDNIKTFWELFPNQKMGWIVNFFKKNQVSIETEAIQFLVDMVENNTKELKDICEKLALFFGKDSRISYQEIEKIIFHSKEENVFTLFEKIAGRDLKAALEILQKILLSRETEPVRLLNGLLHQFRKLMALSRLLENNYPINEALMRLGLRSKKVQKVYQEGYKNYTNLELNRIIMLIAGFDLRLRSYKSSLQSLALQLFLYYSIVQGGQGAWKRLATG